MALEVGLASRGLWFVSPCKSLDYPGLVCRVVQSGSVPDRHSGCKFFGLMKWLPRDARKVGCISRLQDFPKPSKQTARMPPRGGTAGVPERLPRCSRGRLNYIVGLRGINRVISRFTSVNPIVVEHPNSPELPARRGSISVIRPVLGDLRPVEPLASER